MKFTMIKDSSFLVVSTLRNVERVLIKEYSNISKALKTAKSVSFYFVESDSQDGTLELLKNLKQINANFNFVSLGNLRDEISDRIERIRFCRNSYVSYIRNNYEEGKWDYVLVLDLDGNCKRLSQRAISSCFVENYNWDACFANQLLGYYDIYALRADNWNDDDCLLRTYSRKLEISSDISKQSWFKRFILIDKIRHDEIYSKMYFIPFWKKWIPVKSAFGGAGIYKAKLFTIADYSKSSLNSHVICEHVDLHINLTKYGYDEFYINPKFINLYLNEHVLNKSKVIRFMKYVKKSI